MTAEVVASPEATGKDIARAPDLKLVVSQVSRELTRNVVEAADGEDGKVVRPSIDVSSGMLPNGQSVASFFDRGTNYSLNRRRTSSALAQAAKIAQSR